MQAQRAALAAAVACSACGEAAAGAMSPPSPGAARARAKGRRGGHRLKWCGLEAPDETAAPAKSRPAPLVGTGRLGQLGTPRQIRTHPSPAVSRHNLGFGTEHGFVAGSWCACPYALTQSRPRASCGRNYRLSPENHFLRSLRSWNIRLAPAAARIKAMATAHAPASPW